MSCRGQAIRAPNSAFGCIYLQDCLANGPSRSGAGRLYAFVFTAGIGENSASVREAVIEGLSWLGASLDAAANESGQTRISGPESRIGIYVIPTDEELMIARHTLATLSA